MLSVGHLSSEWNLFMPLMWVEVLGSINNYSSWCDYIIPIEELEELITINPRGLLLTPSIISGSTVLYCVGVAFYMSQPNYY